MVAKINIDKFSLTLVGIVLIVAIAAIINSSSNKVAVQITGQANYLQDLVDEEIPWNHGMNIINDCS